MKNFMCTGPYHFKVLSQNKLKAQFTTPLSYFNVAWSSMLNPLQATIEVATSTNMKPQYHISCTFIQAEVIASGQAIHQVRSLLFSLFPAICWLALSQ